MAEINQIIGLDVGQKRTGIARASMIAKIPEPLMAVETDKLLGILPALIESHGADALIIGLPRSLDGDDTEQTKWVRLMAKQLKEAAGIPAYWQDEALTTVEASQQFDTTKTDVDSASACIILDDFLKTDGGERVQIP